MALGPTAPRRLFTKSEHKKQVGRLQGRLSTLQFRIRDSDRFALIALEGPDESGKSSLARTLLETLDPRGFRVWHTYAPQPHEIRRPWLYRFWLQIPRCGALACFDRSWYGRVLVERVEGLVSGRETREAYRDIEAFEKALADDGAVIIKLLMNLSKGEQRRRFDACEADPNQRWRIKSEDWRAHSKFGRYRRAFRDMVRETSTPRAPWTIIPADDRRAAEVSGLDAIVRALTKGLK